ncbi:hypothetical protein HY311_01125 [Candidatus Nomurabacteria bacterium]|nr:hypothetical protein [Candidatus Nomurabacteria bacterium]
MDKKIKEILSYSVMAPSGDNSQPWRFVLSNTTLRIYNLPDKDNPYLNFMQGGSLIAHGALLKNIEIASPKLGLVTKIKLFPEPGDLNLVAEINFENSLDIQIDPLFEFIAKRATNRRPYEQKQLSGKENILFEEAGAFDDVSVHFITDTENKNLAGTAGSSAEIIILENKLLHEYLFKDVMWSEKQERKEKHGLYIKTMEFNPVQRLLFKLASNKILMRLAVKIHLPYFIAKQDAVLYSSSSVMGLLTLKKISPENFVKLGMKLQEIWLKTTSLGLAFQPVAAILFLGFKLQNSLTDQILSQKHKKIALKSYQDIFSAFNLSSSEVPLLMFRVGYAKNPSARSSRKEPVIE